MSCVLCELLFFNPVSVKCRLQTMGKIQTEGKVTKYESQSHFSQPASCSKFRRNVRQTTLRMSYHENEVVINVIQNR